MLRRQRWGPRRVWGAGHGPGPRFRDSLSEEMVFELRLKGGQKFARQSGWWGCGWWGCGWWGSPAFSRNEEMASVVGARNTEGTVACCGAGEGEGAQGRPLCSHCVWLQMLSPDVSGSWRVGSRLVPPVMGAQACQPGGRCSGLAEPCPCPWQLPSLHGGAAWCTRPPPSTETSAACPQRPQAAAWLSDSADLSALPVTSTAWGLMSQERNQVPNLQLSAIIWFLLSLPSITVRMATFPSALQPVHSMWGDPWLLRVKDSRAQGGNR